jgi:molybdopterin synthase catalytic subunit
LLTRVLLTRGPIAESLAGLEEPWRAWSASPARADGTAGACLEFQGIVRDREEDPDAITEGEAIPADPAGYPIRAIDYEAHEEMAVHQIRTILTRLSEKYPLTAALVIHRVGVVQVGEASLLLRFMAPHRQEALAACAEFIDELKRWVPIWKHPVRA